jgi:hypothetical protein
MAKIIDPDWDCLYKKNPAFYIINDALELFTLAEKAKNDSNKMHEEVFSRATILLFPVALEAIINVVYEYYDVYGKDELRKISAKEKWLNASTKCLPMVGTLKVKGEIIYKKGDHVETFDENSDVFLKYIELKDIRNDIVHLKPDFVHIKFDNIEDYEDNYGIYPVTKIPKELSAWKFEHASIAKSVFDKMIYHLNTFMKGDIELLLAHPAFVEKIVEKHT